MFACRQFRPQLFCLRFRSQKVFAVAVLFCQFHHVRSNGGYRRACFRLNRLFQMLLSQDLLQVEYNLGNLWSLQEEWDLIASRPIWNLWLFSLLSAPFELHYEGCGTCKDLLKCLAHLLAFSSSSSKSYHPWITSICLTHWKLYHRRLHQRYMGKINLLPVKGRIKDFHLP